MNTKIVIAVITLIVIAVGVYFFYFRKQNQAQEPEMVGSGQTKGKIVLYSSSGCPHCIDLKDDWEKFLNKSPINGYNVVTMEDAESDILETEDVQGFPTIRLYKDSGEVVEYTGNRTCKSLEEFANSN